MFDETANGFSPAPDDGEIVANRFGQEVAGKGDPSGGNLRLVRGHCYGRCYIIPEDGLDVVGYAKNKYRDKVGV